MSTFERIVRPFQKDDVFNARVLPPMQVTVEPSPPITVEWSGAADTKYVEEPAPGTLGFQAEWEEDKTKRVVDTVKVTNDADPTQFVTVDRIKSATFVNNKSGEQLTIKPDL